jgi:hypothetical protein
MGSGQKRDEYPISNKECPITKFLATRSKGHLKIGSWKLVIGSSNGDEVEGNN